MSRIDEIVRNLCPEGIKYKSLMDLCGTITTGKLNANAMVENGKYPFYTCDATPFRIDKYAFDEEAILISGNGSQVGHINYYKGKFNAYQRTYVLYDFNDVKVKYLLHYLSGYLRDYIIIHSKKGSVPYITLPMLQNFKVPVPPLEVQCEIVHILDELTIKSEKLNQDLNKELVLRQKQYRYYKEKIICKNINTKWVPLLNVANTYTGLTYKPSDVSSDGTLVLRSSNIQNNKLCFDDNVFVSIDNIPERAIVKENDILICVRNGSKALIGKSAIITKHDKKMAFGAFMTILRATDEINSRYLLHVWQSSLIQDMIHNDSGMPINQITKKMLEKMKIPVPEKEEQEKIADTLDKFDAIFSEILDKINCEIDSQLKQYKYYMNKILSFKEGEEDV